MCNVDKVLFCGDIHGELKKLIFLATQKYKLANACIIICGDFGIGFSDSQSIDMMCDNAVKRRMKENNLYIKVVRGNHDDPSYFDGNHNTDRIELLQDHVPFEVLGKTIYPIGGATSIDKELRLKYNRENKKGHKSWWGGENVTKLDIDKLPNKVDIIISHEAPLNFDPVLVSRDNMSSDIYEAIRDDRKYLSEVENNVIYSRWFYGHYHINASGSRGDLLHRCLPPHELFKVYQ